MDDYRGYLRLNISGRSLLVSESAANRFGASSLFAILYSKRRGNNDLETGDVGSPTTTKNSVSDDEELSPEVAVFMPNSGEYFVERVPMLADLALYYIQTGQLHCPPGVCRQMLSDELQFWRLPQLRFAGCCGAKREPIVQIANGDLPSDNGQSSVQTSCVTVVGDVERNVVDGDRSPIVRRRHPWLESLQLMFDQPDSSKKAYVFNFFCAVFVLVSVTNLVLSTMPSLHHCRDDDVGLSSIDSLNINETTMTMTFDVASTSDVDPSSLLLLLTPANETLSATGANATGNATSSSTSSTSSSTSGTPRRRTLQDKFSGTCEGGRAFDIIETICVGWFTVEMALRFVACPQKLQFFKSPLNVLDAVATVPFYVELVIWASGVYSDNNARKNGVTLLQVLRVTRISRVLRIVRLARYFESLQLIGETIWYSKAEFGLLALFLAVTTVMFSTLIFYVEMDVDDTPYTSIPASFWWCIVTLTTTGFGDMVPTTVVGKIIAGLACITGILILALPVTILVEKFRTLYDNKRRLKLRRKSHFSNGSSVDPLPR